MDPDPPPRAPRKGKFAPKPPPPRRTPPANTVTEAEDEADQRNRARMVTEHLKRRKPKGKGKCTTQVSLSPGVESNTILTFGKGKKPIDDTSDKVKSEYSTENIHEHANAPTAKNKEEYKGGKGKKPIDDTSDEPKSEDSAETMQGHANAPTVKKKEEYKVPWIGIPPIELPWRMPNSGDPELLNAAEFNNVAEYDENSVSFDPPLVSKDGDAPKLIFFQLPSNLPLQNPRPSRVSKGKEEAGSSANQEHGKKGGCSLKELPEGYMGKMLVYKSGAVKMKLGDTLFDVSPGAECKFSQNVMAMNSTDKECFDLGEVNTLAVITPDIDSLLGDD